MDLRWSPYVPSPWERQPCLQWGSGYGASFQCESKTLLPLGSVTHFSKSSLRSQPKARWYPRECCIGVNWNSATRYTRYTGRSATRIKLRGPFGCWILHKYQLTSGRSARIWDDTKDNQKEGLIPRSNLYRVYGYSVLKPSQNHSASPQQWGWVLYNIRRCRSKGPTVRGQSSAWATILNTESWRQESLSEIGNLQRLTNKIYSWGRLRVAVLTSTFHKGSRIGKVHCWCYRIQPPLQRGKGLEPGDNGVHKHICATKRSRWYYYVEGWMGGLRCHHQLFRTISKRRPPRLKHGTRIQLELGCCNPQRRTLRFLCQVQTPLHTLL